MKHQSILVILAVMALSVVTQAEPRGWLGVYRAELSSAMKIALGVEQGVIVDEVVSGSPAEKAGLKPGDVILRVDTEEIYSTADLNRYVGSRPDQPVLFRYLRQGKTDSVSVKLGTRERQLEFPDQFPIARGVTQEFRPAMKSLPGDFLAEIRSLREQIAELRKEIERLRKDLKKLEKK
jgi:membrane-associated protease RseP (regulator of RpoE activity)